jgi:putative glutathione S-transferase
MTVEHSQLYHKADPTYEGRYTVPTLRDRKRETIVNNESSEIIRMFYTAFDSFIDPSLRETSESLLPADKLKGIEAMNEWVYNTINNGVYKCGFASTQEAYNTNVHALFNSLNRLESHLAANQTPFLFGDHITEADIRLYPTIARFDAAYFTLFKCNLEMIRYDYPSLHKWHRRLCWDTGEETNGGAFGSTTHFTPIKEGYTYTLKETVVPAGPVHPILPLDWEENH